MWTKYFKCEVLALVVLTIIPWPGPTVFKISCSRDSASIVRKIIQKKWTPILEKYHVKVPIECPFHPMRDIFGPQQFAKQQHRPSQWSCGFCGKSFYEEKYLELHFDNIHKSKINMAEDAVCLADYCDIMRCEVFLVQEMNNQYLNEQNQINTDVEIWREATAYRTALTLTGTTEVVKVLPKNNGKFHQELKHKKISLPSSSSSSVPTQNVCIKLSTGGNTQIPSTIQNDSPGSSDGDGNITKDTCDTSDIVDSALPPSDKNKQRLSDLQKLKANCKPEELQKLKMRCQSLIRNCIAGLLLNLFEQDFKDMEEELNRGICWYLTCDRYWEDSHSDMRPFPWGLVFVFVMVLSLGICLVYYAIWVLFDSDDGFIINETEVIAESGIHQIDPRTQQIFADEHYTSEGEVSDIGQNEHYIYVTYPPELKRRLLESCYNRTTRL